MKKELFVLGIIIPIYTMNMSHRDAVYTTPHHAKSSSQEGIFFKSWKERISYYFTNYLKAALHFDGAYYVTVEKESSDTSSSESSCFQGATNKGSLEKHMTIEYVNSCLKNLKVSNEVQKKGLEDFKKQMVENYRLFLAAEEEGENCIDVVESLCLAISAQDTRAQKIISTTLQRGIIGIKVLARPKKVHEGEWLVIIYPSTVTRERGIGKRRAQAIVNALAATRLIDIEYRNHYNRYAHQLIPDVGLFAQQGLANDRLNSERQEQDEYKMVYFDEEGVYYNKNLSPNSFYTEKSPYRLENPLTNKKKLLGIIQSSGDFQALDYFYSALEFGGDPEVVQAGYDNKEEISNYIEYKRQQNASWNKFLKSKSCKLLAVIACLGAGAAGFLSSQNLCLPFVTLMPQDMIKATSGAAAMGGTFMAVTLIKKVLLSTYQSHLNDLSMLEQRITIFNKNFAKIFDKEN